MDKLLSYLIRLTPAISGGAAERVHQLREELCPEIAGTSAFGVSLACLIGKSYDFAVYRVVQGFFPGGIRLKMRFDIADSQVDALFRLTHDTSDPAYVK